MVNSTSNDNEISVEAAPDCDANGQAALLLVESLIHGLMEQKVLQVGDAIDIVNSATDIARLLDEAPPTYRAPHALLSAIHSSLSHDLPSNT